MIYRPTDAERYRFRAEECRTAASDMRDPGTRAALLQCAAGYDRMAVTADKIRDANRVLSAVTKDDRP